MKARIKIILISLITTLLTFIVLEVYTPIGFFEIFKANEMRFGTALTTIQGTDTLSNSRTTINNNFTALNNGKLEITDYYSTTTQPSLTSLPNLSTVGTITSGVWTGTTINVNKGGTGSTTLSQYSVLLGSSTNPIFTVSGLGTDGQFLTSQGAGKPPHWTTAGTDLSIAYTWTGAHTFNVATTTIASTTAASLDYSQTYIKFNGVNYKLPNTLGASSTVMQLAQNGQLVWQNLITLYRYAASDTLQQSADTTRSEAGGSYVKVKEIRVERYGTIRVKFDLRLSAGGGPIYGRVYKNGVAQGTEQNSSSGSFTTLSEDLDYAPNDLIQLYIKGTGSGSTAEIRNFRLYYDLSSATESTVITD